MHVAITLTAPLVAEVGTSEIGHWIALSNNNAANNVVIYLGKYNDVARLARAIAISLNEAADEVDKRTAKERV